MRVSIVCVFVLFVACAAEEKFDKKNLATNLNRNANPVLSLQPADATQKSDQVKRNKKSATTTFCVEIRPSGPYQKPFQVCEQDQGYRAPQYEVPTPPPSYYNPAPSYGAPPQITYKASPEYAPPKPVYGPPAPQYGAPATPAPAYGPPKSSYSAPPAPSYGPPSQEQSYGSSSTSSGQSYSAPSSSQSYGGSASSAPAQPASYSKTSYVAPSAYSAPKPAQQPAAAYAAPKPASSSYSSSSSGSAAAYAPPKSTTTSYSSGSSAHAASSEPSSAPAYGSSPSYRSHSIPNPHAGTTRSNKGDAKRKTCPTCVARNNQMEDDEDSEMENLSSAEEEAEVMPEMRSADFGGYGDDFGYEASPVSYITEIKAPKKQALLDKPGSKRTHSGLVITCSPSLAGYGAGSPSYSSPKYRSSYSSYRPKPHYKPPPKVYGGGSAAPGYAGQVHSSAPSGGSGYGKAPVKGGGSSYASKSGSAGSSPVYGSPSKGSHSATSAYGGAAVPAYAPVPVAPQQSYGSGYGAQAAPSGGYGNGPGKVPSGYGAAPSGGYSAAPSGAYGAAPSGGYGSVPSGSHGASGKYGPAPSQGYEPAPSGSHGAASSGGYAPAPSGGYGAAPSGGHGSAISEGYGAAPSRGYGSPSSGGYGPAPSAGYGAAPSEGYGSAPSGGYGAPPSGGYKAAPSAGYGASAADGYGGEAASAGGYGSGEPSGGYGSYSAPGGYGGYAATSQNAGSSYGKGSAAPSSYGGSGYIAPAPASYEVPAAPSSYGGVSGGSSSSGPYGGAPSGGYSGNPSPGYGAPAASSYGSAASSNEFAAPAVYGPPPEPSSYGAPGAPSAPPSYGGSSAQSPSSGYGAAPAGGYGNPSTPPQPSGYGSAPAYSAPPKYNAPAYKPPGTYRQSQSGLSEDHSNMKPHARMPDTDGKMNAHVDANKENEKELHTIQKMDRLTKGRTAEIKAHQDANINNGLHKNEHLNLQDKKAPSQEMTESGQLDVSQMSEAASEMTSSIAPFPGHNAEKDGHKKDILKPSGRSSSALLDKMENEDKDAHPLEGENGNAGDKEMKRSSKKDSAGFDKSDTGKMEQQALSSGQGEMMDEKVAGKWRLSDSKKQNQHNDGQEITTSDKDMEHLRQNQGEMMNPIVEGKWRATGSQKMQGQSGKLWEQKSQPNVDQEMTTSDEDMEHMRQNQHPHTMSSSKTWTSPSGNARQSPPASPWSGQPKSEETNKDEEPPTAGGNAPRSSWNEEHQVENASIKEEVLQKQVTDQSSGTGEQRLAEFDSSSSQKMGMEQSADTQDPRDNKQEAAAEGM